MKKLVLHFDPMNCEDKRLQKIFLDQLARKFYLIYRPGHLVDQNFNDDCLLFAELWRKHGVNNVHGFMLILDRLSFARYVRIKFEDAEHLWRRMNDKEPEYEIDLSGYRVESKKPVVKKTWRVRRVRREVAWLEIDAETREEAKKLAEERKGDFEVKSHGTNYFATPK